MMADNDPMGIDAVLYKRLKKMDVRLREYDENFIGFGELYVQLSHKLDTVIRQTADLPAMRDDIAYLKIKAAKNENSISKINEQLIRMEAKDGYMLERINDLDARVTKISNREYA